MNAPHIACSVVVPVYNTSRSLQELSDRVDRVFTGELKETYEIVFVNDGSANPETWPALQKVCAANPNARAIALSRNFGQSAATLCGLQESRGEYVITMDDDLQHRPEDIPALLAARDHDIVLARLEQKKHGLGQRIASRIKGRFDQIILGKPRGISTSSFRVLSRMVVDGVLSIYTPYPFIPALLFYVSKDVVNVPVRHQERAEGRTGYSFLKLLRLFSNLLINNSALLLRVIGYLGISIALASFGLGLYYIWKKWAYGTPVVGWTSVIVSVLLIGGLTLFSVGVAGEYLVRIITGVERKPTYVIRARSGGPRPP